MFCAILVPVFLRSSVSVSSVNDANDANHVNDVNGVNNVNANSGLMANVKRGLEFGANTGRTFMLTFLVALLVNL